METEGRNRLESVVVGLWGKAEEKAGKEGHRGAKTGSFAGVAATGAEAHPGRACDRRGVRQLSARGSGGVLWGPEGTVLRLRGPLRRSGLKDVTREPGLTRRVLLIQCQADTQCRGTEEGGWWWQSRGEVRSTSGLLEVPGGLG